MGLAIGAGLFAVTLHRAGLDAIARELRHVGPLVLLLPLPQGVGIALHAQAWRGILHLLGHALPWRTLTEVHLTTEAARLTVPGGAAVAEAMAGLALHRQRVPLPDVVASLATKRLLVVSTHALYAALALAGAWGALGEASRALLGDGRLPAVMALMAGALAALATTLAVTLRRDTMRRIHHVAQRLPSERLRRWLGRRTTATAHLDDRLALPLAGGLTPLVGPTAALLAQWMMEALESWLLLQLLGVSIGLPEVMAMEMAASAVRSAVVVVPAGLGIQDAGYLWLLGGFGVAAPIAGSFVVLERAKELVWIAVGGALLARGRGGASPALEDASP